MVLSVLGIVILAIHYKYIHNEVILPSFLDLGFGWTTDWKDGADTINSRINSKYGAGYNNTNFNAPITIWVNNGIRANRYL